MKEENEQLDADFHYIKRGQAGWLMTASSLPCDPRLQHINLMDCNHAGPRKSFRGSEWESSMVEICVLAYLGGLSSSAAPQIVAFSRVGVVRCISPTPFWPLLQVVLPGGLLLPPPEVQFGVVGVWDIPDEVPISSESSSRARNSAHKSQCRA